MGTWAALACPIASLVCGRTPSSQATTIMAISVTFAPLALIAVKACTTASMRGDVSDTGPYIRVWPAGTCHTKAVMGGCLLCSYCQVLTKDTMNGERK